MRVLPCPECQCWQDDPATFMDSIHGKAIARAGMTSHAVLGHAGAAQNLCSVLDHGSPAQQAARAEPAPWGPACFAARCATVLRSRCCADLKQEKPACIDTLLWGQCAFGVVLLAEPGAVWAGLGASSRRSGRPPGPSSRSCLRRSCQPAHCQMTGLSSEPLCAAPPMHPLRQCSAQGAPCGLHT